MTFSETGAWRHSFGLCPQFFVFRRVYFVLVVFHGYGVLSETTGLIDVASLLESF